MSDTIVDMPKVTQMLDAGWQVQIFKGPMGSYEVRATHPNGGLKKSVAKKLKATHNAVPGQTLEYDRDFDWLNHQILMTDDFTPEQALTRMAYKVHGEIL